MCSTDGTTFQGSTSEIVHTDDFHTDNSSDVVSPISDSGFSGPGPSSGGTDDGSDKGVVPSRDRGSTDDRWVGQIPSTGRTDGVHESQDFYTMSESSHSNHSLCVKGVHQGFNRPPEILSYSVGLLRPETT